MVTQKQLKEHFLGLKGALYVWGANCQVITKELMDKLYKTFGNKTYNKAYYDGKLKKGAGKIGADCSGSLYPLSKHDTTAANYYAECTKKGSIDSLPKNKVCLVFKKNSKGKINHVGCYTGDGYVCEMANSTRNYQRKALAGNGWDYWGFPDFVSDYDKEEPKEQLKVDGSWGKDTTKKSQQVLGTKVDGIVSKQKYNNKKYVQNGSTASWEFKTSDHANGSNLVRAIQNLVGAAVDGQCGQKTIKAMQKFLNNKDYACGEVDGYMGEKTVKAWQRYINSRL